MPSEVAEVKEYGQEVAMDRDYISRSVRQAWAKMCDARLVGDNLVYSYKGNYYTVDLSHSDDRLAEPHEVARYLLERR